MPVHSLFIINKAGGLIYQKDYTDGIAKLTSNEYLVLAGTFHSIHVITSKLSPTRNSSGIEVLEADSFKMFCSQTLTGTKFLLVTDPAQSNVDAIMRKLHETFGDYVMKNPFYTPEMPIRAELLKMILVVKRNTDTLFLMETPVTSLTDDVVSRITDINNKRLKLGRLIDAATDLAQHGLMRPESEQGYTIEELEELKLDPSSSRKVSDKVGKVIERNGISYIYNPDPTGRRNGEGKPRIYNKIYYGCSKTAHQQSILIVFKAEMISEAVSAISGALTMAYPMGLPDFEPASEIIRDVEDLSGTAASKEVIEFADASLWWAGKEITLGKQLSDFVGKNDKTKVIVKLQRKSQGAPVRESPLDEQAQKEMMAFYYKKQEEHKGDQKLLENTDDEYVNSAWANPKSLKAALNGANPDENIDIPADVPEASNTNAEDETEQIPVAEDENAAAPPEDEEEKPVVDTEILSAEMIGQHISLLARTGNGLSHAYTKLEMHGKSITNIDILENYVHLRYIDLAENSISDISSLASLEYLLSINFHSNKIRKIPANLDRRKYLQQANFAKNMIDSIEIVTWPMLAWLNLNAEEFQAGNEIAVFDLEDKPNLQVLHLRDNKIVSLQSIGESFKSLTYINLRNNLIDSLDEITRLGVVPNLKILNLTDNPVTKAANYRIETIYRCKNLEKLDKELVTDEEREEAATLKPKPAELAPEVPTPVIAE
ncbi:hypothetical protein HDU83_009008 [Entophlyctis luteolus]|nr:hypothetical protein HDU83_009008 [Entophlyctis luteolus]